MYYVTTPIYYVNALPHIGHIYTTVVADTLARYQRLQGKDVRFLTGTDEHGQKIEEAAQARGIKPIELADEVVAEYHRVWKAMGMTHDDFIRTTDPRHAEGVREIIRRIADSGDFYVSEHEGWYCTGCETYYTEKELTDGKCPVHERPAEKRTEENVFFRLSKYQDRLLEWYDSDPSPVQPDTRRNEVRQFVDSGLRDLSVSRQNLDWGISFPGYEGHTIYVWLDALTNYISALGFGQKDEGLYGRYWDQEGERVHLVGKDILRFHTVYWPAFLMAAGLRLPTKVWAHGWWLRDERKMSKSTGNVVKPGHLIERFGSDALRYFTLAEMVFGEDASFSDEAFIDRYNSDLANDLGNTVSRIVTLSRRAFDNHLPPAADGGPLKEAAEEAVAEYRAAMDSLAFHRAIQALRKLLQVTNQYLVQGEPWKKIKNPDELGAAGEVLWNSAEAVRIVTAGMLPILPEKAPQVLAVFGLDAPTSLDALAWGGLPDGGELPETAPLFPRIDKKAYLAEIAAEAEKAEKEKALEEKEEEKVILDAPEERISIDQFFETTLRVGTVLEAEKVPKSSKLLKLSVDVGEAEPRTLVAGIGKAYAPEDLIGTQVGVVWNLKPAKLMGIESNGMVMAATKDGKPVLMRPEQPVPNGTQIK